MKMKKKPKKKRTFGFSYLGPVSNEVAKQMQEDPNIKTFVLAKTKDMDKDKLRQAAIFSLYGLSVVNVSLLALSYLWCLITLNRYVISNSLFYVLFVCVIIPVCTWFILTTYPYFKIHNHKITALKVTCFNVILGILQPVYTLNWDLAIKAIFKIPVTEAMTPNMIINLARIEMCAVMALSFYSVYIVFQRTLFCEKSLARVELFELNQILDIRPDKEYLYDFVAVRNLKTGKIMLVKMNDRFVHFLILGASGTGKTSSIFTSQIVADIKQLLHNRYALMKELLELLKSKKIEIVENFYKKQKIEIETGPGQSVNTVIEYNGINRKYFRAKNPAEEAQLDKLFKRIPLCGITAVSPDGGMNEDLIRFCHSIGEPVYHLDPTKDCATYENEILCGMNPMQVPEKFFDIKPGEKKKEAERKRYIHKAATNICEAVASINELNGSTDPYFADVNYTVLYNVCCLLMLQACITQTQTNMRDLRNHVDEFALLKNPKAEVQKFFEINVRAAGEQKLFGADTSSYTDKETEDAERNVALLNPYYSLLHIVETSLKPGGKLDEQSVGLRNLLGKILQDPDIEKLFVDYGDKPLIDFDECLSENRITLVNTAMELSQTTSTCFGQLFILNFTSAVLRRPKKTRSPHFFFIDEAPRYLSEAYDTQISLFRKYRVSCSYAMQSLSQGEKNPTTKYLGKILQDVGTFISFGATNVEDSKVVSDLGGTNEIEVSQKTYAHASIFAENPNTSFSERLTPDLEQVLNPADVRFRNFQELTFITRDEGRVLKAQLGKAAFVPEEDFEIHKDILQKNYAFRKDFAPYLPKNITAAKTSLALAKQASDKKMVSTNKSGENTAPEQILPKSEESASHKADSQTLAEILAKQPSSVTVSVKTDLMDVVSPNLDSKVLNKEMQNTDVSVCETLIQNADTEPDFSDVFYDVDEEEEIGFLDDVADEVLMKEETVLDSAAAVPMPEGKEVCSVTETFEIEDQTPYFDSESKGSTIDYDSIDMEDMENFFDRFGISAEHK